MASAIKIMVVVDSGVLAAAVPVPAGVVASAAPPSDAAAATLGDVVMLFGANRPPSPKSMYVFSSIADVLLSARLIGTFRSASKPINS